MKIAQGYNPDRVTEQDLGVGYRTIPRKYLKGEHDLEGVAEVWDGSSWDKVLIWADDTDTHRTTLTNAQLGLRKKKVTVDLKQSTLKRNDSGIWELGVDPSPEPVWRNITEAERLILREAADRNAAFNWEIKDLKWRDLSEAERTALRALHTASRTQFRSMHFRHDGIKSWYVGTCIFADGPNLRYQTDLTEAEVAALVKPPWRQLTPDERKALRQVKGVPVEYLNYGIWEKTEPAQLLAFLDKPEMYRTSLTPDEMAKWIAEHAPAKPVPTPKPEPVWRPITEDERKKLHDTKIRLDFSKFKWGSRDSGQLLSFSDPANCYTTTLTPAELAKLTEVWRPLSLAEVKIMRRAKGYDPSRFRCDLGSAKDHSFKTWDFSGAVATNYQTTYSEQEIADLL